MFTWQEQASEREMHLVITRDTRHRYIIAHVWYGGIYNGHRTTRVVGKAHPDYPWLEEAVTKLQEMARTSKKRGNPDEVVQETPKDGTEAG